MSNSLAVHSTGSFDTDIVVDLGCCGYARGNKMEDSIQTLIKRFKPKLLLGFDPHPGLTEGVGNVHGTVVVTSRRAAWTKDGFIDIEINGNCTHIVEENTSSAVASCFDIAAWFHSLPDVKIVLKLDVEGAEYVLLPHLIEHGVMTNISRLLIEWHKGKYANGYETDTEAMLKQIECPIEEWQ